MSDEPGVRRDGPDAASEADPIEGTIVETVARLMNLISDRAQKQAEGYLPPDRQQLKQSSRATLGNVRGTAASLSQVLMLAGEWAVDAAAQWTTDQARRSIETPQTTATRAAGGGESTADHLVVQLPSEELAKLRVYNVGNAPATVVSRTTPLRSFDTDHEIEVSLSPDRLRLAAGGAGSLELSLDGSGAPAGTYHGHVQVIHENDPSTAIWLSIRAIVANRSPKTARPATDDISGSAWP